MKHRVIFYSIVNNTCRQGTVWVENLKELWLHDKKIETQDRIFSVSFAKNMVILLTGSPEYRYAPDPNPEYVPDYGLYNYVNAYDYDGNHLWNIAEIIGDVGFGICAGHVCSTEYLVEGAQDAYIEGHELFVCWDSLGMRYMIDLDEKKVIHKMITR